MDEGDQLLPSGAARPESSRDEADGGRDGARGEAETEAPADEGENAGMSTVLNSEPVVGVQESGKSD